MAVASEIRDLYEIVERELQGHDAKDNPALLLNQVKCIDARSGEVFEFQLIDEDAPWHWQRALLDSWLRVDQWIGLKARQIGITWLAAGFGLWKALASPGARVLIVSINEEEAAKVVNRIWDMYLSLPEHLKFGTVVLKPTRGARPHTTIELEHPDKKVSSIIGLPSTKKAGHGETAALVILDEFSRQDYAPDTWKAVVPTMADGGKILVISTANGVSNEQTGEGNYFHHLWVNAENYGIAQDFLPWSLHPDRDDDWYSRLTLKAKDKAEQYPNDAEEAFILSGGQFFDEEALDWYRRNATRGEWLDRFEFEKRSPSSAARATKSHGLIKLLALPESDRSYAIAADVATGRGADYSCAYVLDLSDMTICAELHGKIDPDLFAWQLHFLGRWFNTAIIAVEMGGGFGEPVVIALRDGKDGRPAYPKLYRHRMADRSDLPEAKPYGFPMNLKTRPLVINQLEKALREHALPFLTDGLLSECRTFTYQKTNPSPRAQEGCNDDRVMAMCIALDLYRQYGEHPDKRKPAFRKSKPPYPWMEA